MSEQSDQRLERFELGGRFIDGARTIVDRASNNLSQAKLNLNGKLSRLNQAVRIAAVVAVITTSGCGNIKILKDSDNQPSGSGAEVVIQKPTSIITPTLELTKTSTPELTITSTPIPTPEPTKIMTPTETPQPLISHRKFGPINFSLDEQNNPVAYQINNEPEVKLSSSEVKKIRDKAITDKETQVFKVIPLPSDQSEKGSSTVSDLEHPVQKELPKDVLTPEQLKKYGVEIIQPDNTNLYIRKQAFEKGGPLADYADGTERLKIVLVNGPFLSDKYMTDPRYKKYVKHISRQYGSAVPQNEFNVEQYRDQEIQRYNQTLEDLRQKKTNNQDGSIDDSIEKYKIKIYLLQHASAEQLMIEKNKNYGVVGSFGSGLTKIGTNRPAGDEYESTAYIAVGNPQPGSISGFLIFDSNGGLDVFEASLLGTRRMEPNATQGNPSYESVGPPGFILRHELGHDELVEGPRRKASLKDFVRKDGSYDYRAWYDATLGDRSEESANELAINGIRSAWEKWKDSGFKDDSGYYFVFRLPGGGYILTENQDQNDEQINKPIV